LKVNASTNAREPIQSDEVLDRFIKCHLNQTAEEVLGALEVNNSMKYAVSLMSDIYDHYSPNLQFSDFKNVIEFNAFNEMDVYINSDTKDVVLSFRDEMDVCVKNYFENFQKQFLLLVDEIERRSSYVEESVLSDDDWRALMFLVFDFNGNGSISREEAVFVCCFLSQKNYVPSLWQKIEDVMHFTDKFFTEADSNRNDCIDKTESRFFMEKIKIVGLEDGRL